MKLSRLLLSVPALLLACEAPPPGALSGQLPRLTPETSCRALAKLETFNGSVTAVWGEHTRDQAFLGRSVLSGSTWSEPTVIAYSPDSFGGLSVTPEGSLATALHSSTAQEPFELLRHDGTDWAAVHLDPPLDWTRQNFPTAVALDSERTVVDIWETNGMEHRQRAFILQAGAWVALEEYQPGTVRRSFHRGTGGALWRAVYPETVPGPVLFHQWTGSDWTALTLEMPVEKRGYLRSLVPTSDGFLVHWDTTTHVPGGWDFTLYSIRGTTVTQLGTAPSSNLGLTDLTVDSGGRPVIALTGFEDQGPTLRAMRLEGTGWRELYRHSDLRDTLEPVAQLTIREGAQDDELYLGWSESRQTVDIGFERHTDCAIQLVRVPLVRD